MIMTYLVQIQYDICSPSLFLIRNAYLSEFINKIHLKLPSTLRSTSMAYA